MWDGGLLEESWNAEIDDMFEVHETTEIPLLGTVAAGVPYRAFPMDETLSVPTTLWGGKQVFALRVNGSSMIDEGIHHGDYLIVEARQDADNGQTVVAEIDGAVTVKKFFREADGAIRLQPANPEMLPLIVQGTDIRIIGIVVGIMRKFGPGRSVTPAPASTKKPKAPTPTRTVKRGPQHDETSLDLALNAIESQLVRWQAAMESAAKDRRLQKQLIQMAELGRDLQALRDSYTRTTKPGLRRALIVEANGIMRKMQRFAAVTPVQLPDLILH